MKRWMPLNLLAALTAAVMACGGAASQAKPPAASPPPGPNVKFQSKLEAVRLDGLFDLQSQVLEFAPTAATVWHTHPAPTLVTVLEGQILLRGQGPERSYQPAESWIDPPGVVHQAANTSQSTSRIFAALIVPKGAQAATPQPGMPAPAVRNMTRYAQAIDGQSMAGSFNVVQLGLSFVPAAQTPRHFHGGVGALTVLEGEITIRNAAGDHVYRAGESFLEPAGEVHQATNRGATPALMIASFVLPERAALTTPSKG